MYSRLHLYLEQLAVLSETEEDSDAVVERSELTTSALKKGVQVADY